jgi:hypothetical protein
VLNLLMFRLCGSVSPASLNPPTAEAVAATLRRVPTRYLGRVRLLVDEADRQGTQPSWYRLAKRRLREDALRRAVRPYVPEWARGFRRSMRRFAT